MIRSSIPTMIMSPRVGTLLTRITEVPDPETALWKVLIEYISLKIDMLRQQIERFESKWKMTFTEFAASCDNDTLGQDPYDYEVESDYWEWEEAETLLEHYRTLQSQWT